MKAFGAIITRCLMEEGHLSRHWGKYALGAGALAAGAAFAPELAEKYHELGITRNLKKAIETQDTEKDLSPYMRKIAAKVQEKELLANPPTISDLDEKWRATDNPHMKKAIEHTMTLRAKK